MAGFREFIDGLINGRVETRTVNFGNGTSQEVPEITPQPAKGKFKSTLPAGVKGISTQEFDDQQRQSGQNNRDVFNQHR